MVPAKVDIGLGLLDLGNHPRLELCYMVVNPGGIAGGHRIHTRSVGGPTGITPAHDACQVPEASNGAGEWAPRVTLRRKAIQQLSGPGPRLLASPQFPRCPCFICSPGPPPCIYLAGILAPLYIASTHHVLLDRVGLIRLGIDVVQAVTRFTTDQWHLKLL